MVYKGHIRNGKIELDEPCPLPEGAQVEIALISRQGAEPSESFLKFAGQAKGLPRDAAKNLDHYLYGHPKQ